MNSNLLFPPENFSVYQDGGELRRLSVTNHYLRLKVARTEVELEEAETQLEEEKLGNEMNDSLFGLLFH